LHNAPIIPNVKLLFKHLLIMRREIEIYLSLTRFEKLTETS
jgi:hypothetical protein